MESLQRDIVELQGTVIDVFSRSRPIRCPSWKFPDKASCDLDLVSLLERYGFAENNSELTQRSHVLLLELIIDRLLLLFQSFTEYAENLISEGASSSPSGAMGPSMSVGLAVRTYWDSMVKLGNLYQQLVMEKKGNKEDVSSREQAEIKRTRSSCSQQSESDVTILGMQDSSLTSSIASGQMCGHFPNCIPSPTTEPPVVPCEACEKAQTSLQEVGRAIVGLCEGQNLPSSLGKFLKTAEETLGGRALSVVDIDYWAAEQSKDISRIGKHLRTLTELVGPLKGELEAAQKQVEDLEVRLQEEKEAQEQQRKEAEQSFEKKHKESLRRVGRLEKEKEDLQNKTITLEKNISTLKKKLRFQEATVQELEQVQMDLLQNMVDKAEVHILEERLEALSGQLQAAKEQLGRATTELDKEKAKAESMLRHKESLQAKQRALMQQLDRLDQECEGLKASLAKEEEERFLMKERLKETREKRREAQHQLEAQQKLTEKAEREKASAEHSASELQRSVSQLGELVQEMKEKERLLVLFPELHIPVEAQFEGTGDVLEDMAKQLQANNIRISVLEEENTRLRAAVAKVKEVAQQEGPKILPPTQLWNQSSADTLYEDGGVHAPIGGPTAVAIQGVAIRHPSRHDTVWSRCSASGNATSSSQRTLGNSPSKPSSGESFAFAYKDLPHVKGRGRGTRGHQK
nr:coiled-coil domain-containing protein 157 isoform X1 [Anolis sagrei ordinatus]